MNEDEDSDSDSVGTGSSSSDEENQWDEKSPSDRYKRDNTPRSWLRVACRLAVPAFLLITSMIRPHTPYDRISITLPIALTAIFEPLPTACQTQQSVLDNRFPFPDLLSPSAWIRPQSDYAKGWAPSLTSRLSPLAEAYRERTVEWFKGSPPRGFFRWDPARFDQGYYGSLPPLEGIKPVNASNGKEKCDMELEEDAYYNPVSDPMKISNLDHDLLPALREVLDNGNVKIRHVVLVMMEGVRDDAWPLRKDTHFYDLITRKARDADDIALANERLARITPNAERITGLHNGFAPTHDKLNWTDTAEEGFGGVNVLGTYTPATMTSKSYETLLCGTPPMSVSGFIEGDMDAYQPCLPQIFDMLNNVSDHDGAGDDYRNHPWRTALFQSTSEQYDRLDVFDKRLGFHHRTTRREVENDETRRNDSDPMYQLVNYFAYPEPVTLPYLSEYLDDTLGKQERLFLTHVTSTTHHEWDTPTGFPWTHYIHWNGEGNHLNKFLNTMRYHDEWMGTLMNLLAEKGMANETLVVFASDHGLSFYEDCGKEGTYDNDHVSNFRIGLTFRHPHLPRVQYEVNATTLSVLPTILDLLVSSGSLNEQETHVASDLVHDYEGQSLIRPYKKKDGDRRAWSITVVNPGSSKLGMTSADVPWRLTMPLKGESEYRMTNPVEDPFEENLVTSWTVEGLVKEARKKFGEEAAQWASEAVPTGEWWVLEKKRLWRYHTLA